MKSKISFNIFDRAKSFKHAVNGLVTMLKYEHNAWIHTLMTASVFIAGLALKLNKYEWCWIVLAIVSVWAAEALNTAFEFLADVTVQSFHPIVEKAKNVAAGGVLIAAIGSVIIGVLIIGPHLLNIFK
jgi:diacylglycerol kinase (ATP)